MPRGFPVPEFSEPFIHWLYCEELQPILAATAATPPNSLASACRFSLWIVSIVVI